MKQTTKGYKWVHKNEKNKLLHPNDVEKYINDGWELGFSNDYKNKIISSQKPFKNQGRAKDEYKELLRKQKISNSMKGNKNWEFNKSHGSAKQGWYKNIYCDSSWELAFVVYHLEHNIPIKRCTEKRQYKYKDQIRVYVPDFVTPAGIIEIKGYVTEQWKSKIQQNSDILVLYSDDMKIYLEYVINKYGEKYWEVLYDK